MMAGARLWETHMKQVLMAAAFAVAVTMTASPAFAQNRTTLQTGFTPDPYEASVTAGGPVEAQTLSADCVGAVTRAPTFTLRYTAGSLPLIISAESAADTTLVVRGPDNAYHCDDDSAGNLNPAVRIEAPRSGRYQIWVGTFATDGSHADASLYISELGVGKFDAQTLPDPSLDPTYGAVSLVSGFEPDPHTQEIAAGGGVDASRLGVPGCVGWIATQPDFRVNWTAGSGALPLVFSVQSGADTTLVINDAQGNWICDDDGGNNGLNPAITIANPPSGQYDIWVGTFAEGPLQRSTLNVSELYAQ